MKKVSEVMLFAQKFTRFIIAFTAVSFLSFPTYGQSENPGWLDELKLQLLLDHQCEVTEYEVLHEGKLGGRNTYTAKAVCKDGRKYDATRLGEDDDFTIRICEIVKC